MLKRTLLSFIFLGLLGCHHDEKDNAASQPPSNNAEYIEPKLLIIGHRGASALRPEHTLAAYQKAIDDGADFIEPDLVPTLDGYLVARHENEIGGTTNVSSLPQFAERKTSKVVDGVTYTGWFTEDFTLNELKQLKARERIPEIRPANAQYNDQFDLPTLDEIIELVDAHYKKTGKLWACISKPNIPAISKVSIWPWSNAYYPRWPNTPIVVTLHRSIFSRLKSAT